jgi:hypothetical protein
VNRFTKRPSLIPHTGIGVEPCSSQAKNLGETVMMKSFGMAAACLLIASAASAQVQNSAPGSDAANHAGVGYSQTQQPAAVAFPASGPARVIDSSAPGSAAANNATVGHASIQPRPEVAPAPAEAARAIDNSAPGSNASNNASVGYQSTK